MIDILYSINKKLFNNNPILEKTRINSVGRLIVGLATNYLLPIYLKLNTSAHIGKNTYNLPIVVSLTSFPARINKVWLTIESIMRQTHRAEKILLWLSKEQFPEKLDSLPPDLIRLQDSGNLEIRFVDGDIRSFKKFYYTFQEITDKRIVTIDDDLLFPSSFLKNIYNCSLRHPNSVIANFGFKFKWNESIGYIDIINEPIDEDETGRHLFFGSGGGTMFKPNKLNQYLDTIEDIMKLCPTADDIYLNSLSRLAGFEVSFVSNSPLLSLWNKSDVKLDKCNGPMGDVRSANAKQLKHLVDYTRNKYRINPFSL